MTDATHPYYDTPAYHFHWQATCRAHDGSMWLRRCGKSNLPALIVCEKHFDQYGALLPSFIDQWFRRFGWRSDRPRRGASLLVDGPDASVPSGPSSLPTSD